MRIIRMNEQRMNQGHGALTRSNASLDSFERNHALGDRRDTSSGEVPRADALLSGSLYDAAHVEVEERYQAPDYPATEERVVDLSLRALFLLVALLLVADLHSSFRAVPAQWEVNPLLAAVAEHVGTRTALLCAKVADLAMLAGLYALWRRSKAHVAVTLVLVIAAFEYAQIVVNNYQG